MFEFQESSDFEFEGPEIQLDSDCDAGALRSILDEIAYSRHYSEDGNRRIKNFLHQECKKADYTYLIYPQAHGSIEWDWGQMGETDGKVIAGGTHYDTVENCPGADDNGSGIALLICAARYLRKHAKDVKVTPHFYFFNREEDGLLGSEAFVENVLNLRREDDMYRVTLPDEVHIMEMVGYTADTQQTPPGLPDFGARGDFLGIVGEGIVSPLVELAGRRVQGLKVKGLDVPLSVGEACGPALWSDHTPFWKAGYKTCMYTDTSFFRNPNYHQPTDTPDTLNYEFMEKVLKLFLAQFF